VARKYVRDARGRFAGGGYSGQTSGRGARLMGGGKRRQGGGAKSSPGIVDRLTSAPKGTVAKSSRDRGLARVSENRTPEQKRTYNLARAAQKDVIAARKQASKPARKQRTPKTGRDIQMAQIRKVQNQKLRDLNRKIKEAGPSASGLRLEKLKLQSAMQSTAPRRR
jgi:hypothetical protein